MSKEIFGKMRKYIDDLESEHISANPDQMEKAEVIQNAMDMGSESPNQPSLSEDAENKDTGGWKSPRSQASGEGESEEERAAKRKAAFVGMYKA